MYSVYMEKNLPEMLPVWREGRCPENGDIGIIYHIGKHENVEWYPDESMLGVISDGIIFLIGSGSVEVISEKEFSQDDLKNGMITQYNNGEFRFVMEGVGLYSFDGDMGYMEWNNIEFGEGICPVTKVYAAENDVSFRLMDAIKHGCLDGYEIIWEFKEQPNGLEHVEKVRRVMKEEYRLKKELGLAEKNLKSFVDNTDYEVLEREWDEIKNKFNSR